MFVDRVKIHVEGGSGGNGSASFRREKYIPQGGPDGGDGGDGGSVLIIADERGNSLAALAHKKHWRAKSGLHGSGNNRYGRKGEGITVHVPPGTIVMDVEHRLVLKDLKRPGDRVIAARGGQGGKGNTHYKSSTNRSPRKFTKGEPGEVRDLVLELKLIADVGTIGMPNAGKSTLLSRMTRARPEIANYPFTTKYPNLGLVRVSLDREFVMADIPGLIEGAHEGVGLGHEFLRHIERTRVLVHLVEPAPMDGTDPLQNYYAIRSELEQYDEKLVDRAEIVAISKSELPQAEEVRESFQNNLQREVLGISAVTGQGLDLLQHRIVAALDRIETDTISTEFE